MKKIKNLGGIENYANKKKLRIDIYKNLYIINFDSEKIN